MVRVSAVGVGGVSSHLCLVFFLLIVFGFAPSKVFHYYNTNYTHLLQVLIEQNTFHLPDLTDSYTVSANDWG